MARIPPIRNPMPLPSRDIFLDLEAPAKVDLGNLRDLAENGFEDLTTPMFPGQMGLLPNRRVCGFTFGNTTAPIAWFCLTSGTAQVGWDTTVNRRYGEYAFGSYSAGDTVNVGTQITPFTTGRSSKRLVALFMFPDQIGTVPTTGTLVNLRFFVGWATGTVANVLGTHDPVGRVVGIQFDTINDANESDFFIVRDDATTFSRTQTDVGVQQALGDATPQPLWYLIEMVQDTAFGPVFVYMAHGPTPTGGGSRAKELVGTVDWFEAEAVSPLSAGVVVGVRNENGAGTSGLMSLAWLIHDEFGTEEMGAPPIPMADTFVPTARKPKLQAVFRS